MRYLTQQELEAGLAKWQAILHLQDWEFSIALVPQTTWESRSQSADCGVCLNTYRAEIRLAAFDSLDLTAAPSEADMERTLVHELLHVVFRKDMLWTHGAKGHERRHFEHAIEQSARAYVELDRRVAA